MTTRPRVLVVDDDESIRKFALRVLGDAGYEVVSVEDGAGALRLTESESRFDGFVLDVMMPEMQGDELGRRLRQKDADAKILYFTGYVDRLFEERATLWENEAFIEKPVTVDGLRQAVSLLLFGNMEGTRTEK
jgi:CheY-like chemotaxis protein